MEQGPGSFNYLHAKMVHEGLLPAGSLTFVTVDGALWRSAVPIHRAEGHALLSFCAGAHLVDHDSKRLRSLQLVLARVFVQVDLEVPGDAYAGVLLDLDAGEVHLLHASDRADLAG